MDGLQTGASDVDVEHFVRRYPRGSAEYLHAALRGVIPGVRRVVFGGTNADVDTASVPEDIWGGDGLIPRPAAAESWEIVSSSASDAAAGTGARTVVLTTLDGNYGEVTQTVTLNGITAVALAGTHLRINAGRVATAGSNNGAVGTLTIRVAAAGAARAYIGTEGLLNQAKYTVPAGYSLDLHALVIGVRASGGTESAVFTVINHSAAGLRSAAIRFPLFVAGTNVYRHEVAGGRVPINTITERGETQIRGTLVTQNNTSLDASAIGLLYQRPLWP